MKRLILIISLIMLAASLADCSNTARMDVTLSPEQAANLVTTSSGLKYVDLVVGTGASPAPTDGITVQYTGTLENGTVFDASRLHGPEPASFPLNSVIKGWTEGVSTMKVGGVRKLIIPPDLAYGDQSVAAGVIPPNSTLVFIVELLDIPKVQIEDTQVGTGAEAIDGKTLVVNYTGWLSDGTQFDTTTGKQPFEFTLGTGQVIPGWDQGLVGMKVGGKRTLIIPPGLAYGAQGASDTIPPNSTLKFEIELLDVK